MKKQIKTILLIAILIVSVGIRFWQLGNVPPSPDWDEAAFGYDAFSIIHTGRDEFGAFLPFVLRSFDDYKPALYVYFVIPSELVFGVDTYAVRFPSAFMGVVGIFVFYLLLQELFPSESKLDIGKLKVTPYIPLVATALLAISPWQIQFSRVAFETNVGLTFNLLIALFFLKGLKHPWMLSLAALFAGLNLAVYQSERVFSPFLVLALAIIYSRQLFKISKKYLAAAIIVGLIAGLPTIMFIVTNTGSLQRIQEASVTSQLTPAIIQAVQRLEVDKKDHDYLGEILDNRRVIYLKEITYGYLVHFDPNWLFIEGDNTRHHAPQMGILYLFDLPFLLIGFSVFLFGKFSKKAKYLIFSWFLSAPVPVAITYEVPHAVRAMNMLPMYILFLAVGYIAVFEFFNNYRVKDRMRKGISFGFYGLFCVLALFNLFFYLNQYFVQQNYFNGVDWQYGYAQAIPQIEKIQGNYKNIIVSNKVPMDESYMFFLYYMQYPPQQYQQLVKQGKNITTSYHQFGKYEFTAFNWDSEKTQRDDLFVGSIYDFPPNIIAHQTIYYPDGKPAILLVDPKENP